MNQGILRHIRARQKLFSAIAIGMVFYFLIPLARDTSTRLLIAWNIAAGCFLIMTIAVMIRSDDADMQRQAQQTDEGRLLVLLSAMVAAAVSLAAVVVEMSRLKEGAGADAGFFIGLSVTTMFVSWSFIQVIFTEHYAHEYYMQASGRRKSKAGEAGLGFPGEQKPDYLDFLYFTVTIGVANQTADIAIRSRLMRILVLVQSVISYFFNAAILALSINIVATIL